jgi:hypothetical protein
MFTREGAMQKILFMWRRSTAKEMPTTKHAGKAGGTAIVMRSMTNDSVFGAPCAALYAKTRTPPRMAIGTMTKRTNLLPSLCGLSRPALGYRMERTSRPFSLLKPVLRTRANTGAPLMERTCRTRVPPAMSDLNVEGIPGCAALLETGIDSPVSIDSDMSVSPERSTQSHGRLMFSSMRTTSPGTRSSETARSS